LSLHKVTIYTLQDCRKEYTCQKTFAQAAQHTASRGVLCLGSRRMGAASNSPELAIRPSPAPQHLRLFCPD